MLRINNLPLVLILTHFLLLLNPLLVYGSQAELEKADTLHKKVVQLYQERRFQDALPYAQQALQIRERILGPEHTPHCYQPQQFGNAL